MSEINNNISFQTENGEAKPAVTVEAGQVINLESDDNRSSFDFENANETLLEKTTANS